MHGRASSTLWWRHPTCISLTTAMQNPCFIYTVTINVAVWLQVCCTVSGQNYPTKGLPYTVLFIGLWPHSFHKSCTCTAFFLVSTLCCDTISTRSPFYLPCINYNIIQRTPYTINGHNNYVLIQEHMSH